jgi:hypothetical protein
MNSSSGPCIATREARVLAKCWLLGLPKTKFGRGQKKEPPRPVRGVDSFIATGDPLLTSISNLRKERKKERKEI